MRASALAYLAIITLSLSGCALGLGKSLHQYSFVDPVTQEQGQEQLKTHRPIKAEVVQNVIIATTNTNFVDEAYNQLLAQCNKGSIVNVVARYSTRLGIFAYDNVISLSGTCVE